MAAGRLEGGGGSSPPLPIVPSTVEGRKSNSQTGSTGPVPFGSGAGVSPVASHGQDGRATAAASPEQRLMQRIRRDWGAAIEAACRYSSIPPEFLAALIANESGGNPQAQRFEVGVYRRLIAVRDAVGAIHESPLHYGSITRQHLAGLPDDALRDLATSWGLTQIMGYHLLNSEFRVLTSETKVEQLLTPGINLQCALRLLADFADRYGLGLSNECAELFRCWNTGGPYGRTHDPDYVPRGLARMAVYRQLGGDEAEAKV